MSRRARSWFLSVCMAVGFGALIVAGFAESSSESALYRSLSDMTGDPSEQIARQYGVELASCQERTQLSNNERAILSALFTLERYSTSWLERLLERGAVSLARIVPVSLPDWSYGPGQVRLSRALSVRENARPRDVAVRLLSVCASLPIARDVLRDSAQHIDLKQSAMLSRSDIVALARAYNGAAARQSKHGALSTAIYQSLVYDLVIRSYYLDRPRERVTAAGWSRP